DRFQRNAGELANDSGLLHRAGFDIGPHRFDLFLQHIDHVLGRLQAEGRGPLRCARASTTIAVALACLTARLLWISKRHDPASSCSGRPGPAPMVLAAATGALEADIPAARIALGAFVAIAESWPAVTARPHYVPAAAPTVG